jgi:hypothetical protein
VLKEIILRLINILGEISMILRVTFFAMVILQLQLFANIQIMKHTDETIHLQFTLPEIEIEKVTVQNKEYNIFGYSNSTALVNQGAPLLPYSIKRIAIPPGATVTVQFQTGEKQDLTNTDVYPLIVVSGDRGEILSRLDESIYNNPDAYPGKILELSEPYSFKNKNVVDIKIYPIQYYPLEKRVRIYKSLSLQINIEGGKSFFQSARISSTEKSFLQKQLVNFDQSQNWALPSSAHVLKTQVNYDFSLGNWYKIPISADGVYRITGGFLTEQGLEISDIQTDMIQIFNYGGTPLDKQNSSNAPEDLNEIAIEVIDNNSNGIFDTDDLIYFYGNGVENWKLDSQKAGSNHPHPWAFYHHPYATTNYYLFTYNQNSGKRIQKQNSIQESNPIVPATFTDHKHFEEDIYNLLSSGTDWYWLKMSGISDQNSLSFSLPSNIAPGPVQMRFRLKDGSDLYYPFEEGSFRDSIDISVNGLKVLDNVLVSNGSDAVREVSFDDIFAIRAESNDLFLFHSGNDAGCQSYLDYFEIQFQRPFQAENNFLKFRSYINNPASEFRISGLASAGNRIWDITDFSNVREIIPIQNSNTVTFQDREEERSPREYNTFTSSFISDVQQIIPVANSPNLKDPSRKGKLLIILPDEFYDAAERLENLRESQIPDPIETERIKLSEIYREFSSCVPDPTAIRNFIRWAYDNWRTSEASYPEFVLLMGDGSYDYKGLEWEDYENRVPTFQIEGINELDSRETDHFYVTLKDNVSLTSLDPHLSLGRVPVNSIIEVENFIDKEIQYANSYAINSGDNGWQTVLTFVADDEIAASSVGEWFHMRDTEKISNSYVPNKFDVKKIYLVQYEIQAGGFARLKPQATEDLIAQINRGTLMINFFGHGNPDTWTHEQIFDKARDLHLINNSGKLPFWIAATCDWGRFDDPGIVSMAEEMVLQKDRGGIGVVAASRPVYASSNRQFVEAFYQSLFNSKSDLSHSKIVGYALLDALQGSVNYQKFRLFGDPSLKIADPKNSIKIVQVEPDTLKALSTVSLNGQVTDNAGNSIPEFQGEALIRVYDTKDTLSANNGSIRYTSQERVIFKGLVSVVNGEIDGEFIVPKSIKYDATPNGRISVYAWSENRGDAVGYLGNLSILGTESLTDNNGPTIDFSIEDQADFFDGDYVSTQPTMIVRLNDESGINLTREVGHRIELSIDGKVKKDVTDFFVYDKDSYQNGQLRYTLPALSSGTHSLTISAWDNVNNLSEREVNFRTTQLSELALEEVVNYPNPFGNEPTFFTFQFQSPSGFADVNIKIYAVSGRLIQEIDAMAQPGFNKIEWDGRDRNGDRLANGVYLYKVIVDDGQKKIEKIEKLAVLR